MTPRSKAACLSAGVLAFALMFGASAALAQDDDGDGSAAPIVVAINGPCSLVVDGRNVACRGVAYMVFPSNGRIDFTAITANAGWAFSGENDDNDEDAYTLEVDSVLTPSASRVDAEGECDMAVSEDRRTVESLECRASTDQGELMLRASGSISTAEADDDDDEN